MICNNTAKMPITSTSHEWTQIDQEASSMAVASKNITDKPPQDLQQPLRCPRCDSSNTKFCYYNNYSLTQPRHFCKACKRYWTRGGTLRNVPVGGSCRKNKRVKRPAAVSGDTVTTLPNLSQGQSDSCTIAKTPLNMASLAFPSLQPQLPSLNYEYLSIPRSSSSLDLPPSLMNTLNWMTFPPGATHGSNNSDDMDQYQHAGSFTYNPTNQFQDQSIASSSLWPADLTASQFLGSSAPSDDLIASTLNQQKLMSGLKEPSSLQVLFPIGDHHSNIVSKGVKMEEDNIASMGSKMDWQVPHCNSSIHENISSGSNLYWNSGVFGSWVEANAHGSLTPLL